MTEYNQQTEQPRCLGRLGYSTPILLRSLKLLAEVLQQGYGSGRLGRAASGLPFTSSPKPLGRGSASMTKLHPKGPVFTASSLGVRCQQRDLEAKQALQPWPRVYTGVVALHSSSKHDPHPQRSASPLRCTPRARSCTKPLTSVTLSWTSTK